jgi:hypothetical protein
MIVMDCDVCFNLRIPNRRPAVSTNSALHSALGGKWTCGARFGAISLSTVYNVMIKGTRGEGPNTTGCMVHVALTNNTRFWTLARVASSGYPLPTADGLGDAPGMWTSDHTG